MDKSIDINLEDDDINFWPVYSDLAVVVIIIMLLFLLGQFVVNAKLIGSGSLTMITNQNKLRSHFVVGRDNNGKDLFRKGIANIQKDGNLQLVTFSSDVIFGLNQSNWQQLSEEGQNLLSSFGSEIAKNQYLITRIQIEGHASWEQRHAFGTEARYNQNNWEISARRALTVAQAFIEQGVRPEKISFAGRAHYVPADQNARSFNEALRYGGLNRRINVIFFYSQMGEESAILR